MFDGLKLFVYNVLGIFLVVQFVLLGYVVLGKLGQLQHLGINLLNNNTKSAPAQKALD